MSVRILQGDCLDVLKTLPDESVHCVVTSPPYWRQRDYGMPGQLGLESTPEEYVDKLVTIFSEVRRVLRTDGTAWVNLGDKWASGGNSGGGSFMQERSEAWNHVKANKGWRSPPNGYKDKDLVGVPWMFAFAARDEGWYLRQCNIWAKPNCMPESVTDRSTVSHEYVFHLTKNNDYWYDADAARTPPQPLTETQLVHNSVESRKARQAEGAKSEPTTQRNGIRRLTGSAHGRHADTPLPAKERRSDKQRGHTRKHAGFNDRWDSMPLAEQRAMGANLRSVWWISPAQYREGHYAVMPAALAEICITAGCPGGGLVLDPFFGAGTTGLVADRLGRDCIGIELNPEYVEMARKRIKADSPMFAEVA